jgi:hypothetical protein
MDYKAIIRLLERCYGGYQWPQRMLVPTLRFLASVKDGRLMLEHACEEQLQNPVISIKLTLGDHRHWTLKFRPLTADRDTRRTFRFSAIMKIV